MASALAAFAYGLSVKDSEQDKKQNARKEEDEEYVLESEDEEQQQEQEVVQNNPATLLDFAKQQQKATSLLQVAQQESEWERAASSQKLANQLNQEDAAANKQRSAVVQSALQATSEQVRADFQAKRQKEVAQAVQQAIVEEQQYQLDEFEEEDPAIQRAANLLIAKATAAAADNTNNGEHPSQKPSSALALSVDRHVLKQRQDRHGLHSKSTTKAKTMKDRLSTFQFSQLSITQRRVFLATLTGDAEKEATGRRKQCNMDAINELAKDKAKLHKQKHLKHKKLEFARLDDTRHCRFQPRFFTGSQFREAKSRNDSDDEGGNNNNANQRNEDFVRRMEAAERAKNEQLRRTREENAYLARVDKKECPICGNPQSYSELSQKRKKCPNCGVTYKNRIAWSDIADQFLERMTEYLESKLEAQRRKEELRRQQDHCAPHRSRLRGNSGLHDNNQAEIKTWAEVQDEFLGRVQLDLMNRELSKETILKEVQQECSFAPCISAKAKRVRVFLRLCVSILQTDDQMHSLTHARTSWNLQLDLGTFDERLRRDLENRSVRQEQYKTLAGAIAASEARPGGVVRDKREPNRGNTTNRKHHGPSANFQERLRLDLEKRREREQEHSNRNAKQRSRPKQTHIKW